MPRNFTKDPDAALDYTVDWSEWLGVDSIATSTWTVPEGITKDADTNTATTATVWLSGGVLYANYTITNTIETAAGRTDQRSITVKVWEK